MLKHAALLAGILAVFYFLARGTVMYGPFGYDEADYMYAASRGVSANCTDTPTLPLPELVRIGLSRGRDASQRGGLSVMIRNSGDMVFYRHWHGPLYVVWLAMVKHLAPSEHAMRAWNYMFPIFTALLLYSGALWLLGGAAGQIAAVLGAVLYLWSYPVISADELAPHELFVFCAVATLLLLAKLVLMARTSDGDVRRYWYDALIMSALAFCTLEITFVLIATLLICGHAVRERLNPDLGSAARSIAAFLVPVLLIWSAAIFKLSFVKAYLFMGYLAIFRKGAWGSDISVAETWWLRFVTTPVPWILLAGAVFILLYRRGAEWSPALVPFAIYAVSMCLAILRVNTEFPRYVLPLFPAVVLLAAFTFGLFLSRFRPALCYATVGLISAAMFLTTFPQARRLHREPDPKAFAMLTLIRRNDLSRKRLLVPYGDLPTIHYYFPGSHPRSYRNVRAVPDELRHGSFDGVLYGGDPPRYVPAGPAAP